MKILEENIHLNKLKLQLETVEDLYFASLLVDIGDLVTAWTTRQIKLERIDGTERGERVRVKVTVKVKKVEFQRFSDSLRILGIIVEAPEWLEAKGSHHTLGLKPGDEIEITKNHLMKHHERVLRIASAKARAVGLISVDVDEIAVGLIRPQGLEVLSCISLPRPNKEGSLKSQVKTALEKALPSTIEMLKSRGVESLILLSPQLLQDIALECLKNFKVSVKRVEVPEGGLAGFYELLRRDELKTVFEEAALTTPKNALTEFLEHFFKNSDKIAIGLEEVSFALAAKAVKKLLILDEALLSGDRMQILSLLEKASETAEDVIVIPPDLEGAEILKKTNGIAALLYFGIKNLK